MPKSKVKSYYSSKKYKSKSNHKRFILFFSLALILAAIPFTITLVKEQQDTRSQAKSGKDSIRAYSLDRDAQTIPGSIVVKYKTKNQTKRAAKARKYQAKVKEKIKQIDIEVLDVPIGSEQQILNELRDDPDVLYAEPEYVGYIDFTPNDPEFYRQDGLHNTGQEGGNNDIDIDAPEAWDKARGTMQSGEPVKVAVLDSGIAQNHPDLSSKIIANANFVTIAPGNDSYDDRRGHGTAVAGIIAATTNNSSGVAGVCPDCQLLNGKVMKDDGSGSYVWWVNGIIWAADNGAQVINMSISGTNEYPPMADAIQYARNKGAIVVSSASNNNSATPMYPAAIPNVISVGGVTNTDTKVDTSNYGTWVDIAAPGDMIYTTSAPFTQLNPSGNQYGYYKGTSMAAPIVSGTVALLWARNGTDVAVSTIENQLFASAEKIAGTGTYWTHGRVNANNAVAVALPTKTPTVTPTVTASPTVTPPIGVTITPIPTTINPPTTVPKSKYMISGTVFVDSNRNGTREPTESAFPNARVSISGATNRQVVTDSVGKYYFTQLKDKSYTVQISLPSGYTITTTTSLKTKITKKKKKKIINFGIAPQ